MIAGMLTFGAKGLTCSLSSASIDSLVVDVSIYFWENIVLNYLKDQKKKNPPQKKEDESDLFFKRLATNQCFRRYCN